VDVKGQGQHRTLDGAIKAAIPGEHIVLLPGVYTVTKQIDKVLSFIGQGKRDAIVIESRELRWLTLTNGSILHVVASGVRFTNLTLRAREGLALRVYGEVIAEDCVITALKDSKGIGHGDGVWVDGVATLRRCNIVNCADEGIVIHSKGKPASVIEDCLISGCKRIGLAIHDGAVVARRNRIVNNGEYGINIDSSIIEDNVSIIEDNDLRGNAKGAWSDMSEEVRKSVQQSGNLE
jgi:hypothetical protein